MIINIAAVFDANGAADFFAEAFAIDPGGDVLRLADIFMFKLIRVFIKFTVAKMAFTACICS